MKCHMAEERNVEYKGGFGLNSLRRLLHRRIQQFLFPLKEVRN